jgi:hypothetical protein
MKLSSLLLRWLFPGLVGLAILGISSVALARPTTYAPSAAWRIEDDRHVVVRDHRDVRLDADAFDDERYEPRYDDRWRDADRDDDRDAWFDDGWRRDRDGRFGDDRFRDDRPYVRRAKWLALTPQLELERGRQIAELHTHERFGQVRLQNQTGRMYVARITIVFANGERQAVEVDRVLDGNHAMVNIDLDGGRQIDRHLASRARPARLSAFRTRGPDAGSRGEIHGLRIRQARCGISRASTEFSTK